MRLPVLILLTAFAHLAFAETLLNFTGGNWQRVVNGRPLPMEDQQFVQAVGDPCSKVYNTRTETNGLAKQTPSGDAVVFQLPRSDWNQVQWPNLQGKEFHRVLSGGVYLNPQRYSAQMSDKLQIWSAPGNEDPARIQEVFRTLKSKFPNRYNILPTIKTYTISLPGEAPNGYWIADSIVLFSDNGKEVPKSCGPPGEKATTAHRYHEIGNLFRIHEPYAHTFTWAFADILNGGDDQPPSQCAQLLEIQGKLLNSTNHDTSSLQQLVEQYDVDYYSRWGASYVWKYMHWRLREIGAPDLFALANALHGEHAAQQGTPGWLPMRPNGQRRIDDLKTAYRRISRNPAHAAEFDRLADSFFKRPLSAVRKEVQAGLKSGNCIQAEGSTLPSVSDATSPDRPERSAHPAPTPKAGSGGGMTAPPKR